MPGSTFAASLSNTPRLLAPGPRLARLIEKEPPRHGEKPYTHLIIEAFDGAVLKLSDRLKLLEEADNRKIRRGDALDLIADVQRELESHYAVHPTGRLHTFFTRYAIFVACYVMFALIWCVLLAR